MNFKKLFALLLVCVMALSLAACGPEAPETPDTGTNAGSDAVSTPASDAAPTDSDEGSDPEPEENQDPVSNLVMACDQLNDRIVVYDMDLLEPGDDLELAKVWEVPAGYCADMKFREDTVFGDVVITAGGTSTIFNYETKEVIWATDNPGNNPHAVEILPDGDIVIANSTGGTVRHFNTSALVNDKNAKVDYTDHELVGAHGLVYDPEYECLWALGNSELFAYTIMGDFNLMKIAGHTLPEKNQSGHDLSADLTNTRYLYLTSVTVLRFDKEEEEFQESFPQHEKLTHDYTTGFGNNPGNNFFFIWGTYSREGEKWEKQNIGEWCSDVIHFGTWKNNGRLLSVKEYETHTSAFYKTRPFYGKYQ